MIILKNGTILNFKPAQVNEKTDVAINGNKISKIGKQLSLKYPSARVIPIMPFLNTLEIVKKGNGHDI